MGILEVTRLYLGELTENHIVRRITEILAYMLGTAEPSSLYRVVLRDTFDVNHLATCFASLPLQVHSVLISLFRSFIQEAGNTGSTLGRDASTWKRILQKPQGDRQHCDHSPTEPVAWSPRVFTSPPSFPFCWPL